ncbi:MAG: M23 family metallopeptidase [Gemmatimonadetes bacterium]|nr:M23 family metallopeptidase [Gemmatimonadota bacterium]
MNRSRSALSALVLVTSVGCLSGPTAAPPVDGCPGGSYPDWSTSPYVLPFPVGQSWRTGLTNCGGSYHSQGLPDAFATDFDMDLGSLITASREGVVVHVEESGRDFDFPNNLVVVDHGDGTFAQYMHLTRDGALVQIGDTVQPGDSIGLSGATGLAGYPHLHFVVTGAWPWPYTSRAVTFRNTSPNPTGLVGFAVYGALAY